MKLAEIMLFLKNIVVGVLNLTLPVGEFRITFMQLVIGYFLLHTVFRIFYGTVGGRRDGAD